MPRVSWARQRSRSLPASHRSTIIFSDILPKRFASVSGWRQDFIAFPLALSFSRKSANLLLTVPSANCTFSPLFRFLAHPWSAQIAQLAEHVLGKDEVVGSNPILGSRSKNTVGQASPTLNPKSLFNPPTS